MSCDEITRVLQSHVKELGIFLSGLGNKWRFKKNFFLVTLGLQFRAQAEFLVAFWDLSSLTRDQSRVPGTGRRILNHWISREVSQWRFFTGGMMKLISLRGLGKLGKIW